MTMMMMMMINDIVTFYSSVVWRWAMGWVIGLASPGRAMIFFSPPRPDGAHPASYPIDPRNSSRVKAAGA